MANKEMIRAFSFACASSAFWLFSHIMNDFYMYAAAGAGRARISIIACFFQWLMYFFLSLLNFIPPFFIRYVAVGKPLYGNEAAFAALLNYASVIMVIAFPWRMLTEGVGKGIVFFLLSSVAKIAASVTILVCGYSILGIPSGDAGIDPPVDNSSRCMLRLADFITYAKKNLGGDISVEKLWRYVYSYLKNDEVISGAMRQGVPADAIVMNAVGAVAYRMIESGQFHRAPGVLAPEGEYIVSVWRMAANELVRQAYNTPDDMARGLAVLEEAIRRGGGRNSS
jgi:hypothetical protein